MNLSFVRGKRSLRYALTTQNLIMADWVSSSLSSTFSPLHWFKWQCCFPRVFDQEIPQSLTADQHTAPIGRATEHQQPHDTKKTTKVKQPALSSPSEMIAKPERTLNTAQQNKNQTQTYKTMGKAICDLLPCFYGCINLHFDNASRHVKEIEPMHEIFNNVPFCYV